MIPLSIPAIAGNEKKYLNELLENPVYHIDKHFTKKCLEWFSAQFNHSNIYLTKSCTQSLEFISLLLNIEKGDEIILPSFIYISAANAFVTNGGVPVFVDIRPDNMNIDENRIEAAITEKTKAIVVMHYAGVSCNMKKIKTIANKHNVALIEDAAHGIVAKYEDKFLGTIGDMGSSSFDIMKNISCGQGGLLSINNEKFKDRAEIAYENGTNKRKFLRGEVPYYSWMDKGSNFQLSEIQSAYLLAQLQQAEEITKQRVRRWNIYLQKLTPLREAGLIDLPEIPESANHNAHVFYLKTAHKEQRKLLMDFLYKNGITATFHYIPLHSTEFGKKAGRFSGEDRYTTQESERLLRLPLYNSITDDDVHYVIDYVSRFYNFKSA